MASLNPLLLDNFLKIPNSTNTTRTPDTWINTPPDYFCKDGLGERNYRNIPHIYALTGQVKDPIMGMFFNRLVSRFFSIDYAQSIYLIL